MSNSMKNFASGAPPSLRNGRETLPPRTRTRIQGPKRNRSPSSATSVSLSSISPSSEVDLEREMRAKAKRMARFRTELAQSEDEIRPIRSNQTPGMEKLGQNMDVDGSESFAPIRGVCPDMCPESERGERERKGDLDKYERLEGERNQTSVSLAVKKYTRTAERDAKLIRPLPVLQRTVDYLLNLLNYPYDDHLLGLYNFLWDRMRAVRLDLRMQHIFNLDAIAMLEKMIRLHIIAMHELSEYSKGEGFSEGFDAHLNIEQMNKTSVELFQMYDDHRKRGRVIPTEKEFRGYYALLKLDKHPGYKVEPAELSLNLASLSPDIRQSPEILFVRDVARASRTGNYVAFFRLARKATYLQACLMHAHFSKLRTHALASLHSGLHNNQGIPIDDVVKWLAIEGEDVDGILEYYGFSIKNFEGPYMVKGGPFLNADEDYPAKCSPLVKLKRSKSILDDVSGSQPSMSDIFDGPSMRDMVVHAVQPVVDVVDANADADDHDDDMSDRATHDENSGEEGEIQPEPIPAEEPQIDHYHIHDHDVETQMVEEHDAPSVLPLVLPLEVHILPSGGEDALLTSSRESAHDEMVPHVPIVEEERATVMLRTVESMKKEEETARMRRLGRRWRRRAQRKREIRERRQSLACAALNSLTLGPPLRSSTIERKGTGCLNIDSIARERYGSYRRRRERINVAGVVAPALRRRNLTAECLVWKLALSLPEKGFPSWLTWKLLGDEEDRDRASPSFSVWRGVDCCCYSVVRAADRELGGSSAVLFLVEEGISWEAQGERLQGVLESIPSGSSLPVSVLVTNSSSEHLSAMIRGLGLDNRCNYRIFCLDEKWLRGDEELESCLLWLAENSPIQPSVREVRVRDLVSALLNAALVNLHSSDPDEFVAVFNRALDNSAAEIAAAADSNKHGSPPLEIQSLPEGESEAVARLLPRVDWSSPARIQLQVAVIRECKLPRFPGEWRRIGGGFEDLRGFAEQKAAIEFLLLEYLGVVGLDESLASLEARVMVQKMIYLERRSDHRRYFLAPDWNLISRRIFNWRLLALSSAAEKLMPVYVRTETEIPVLDSRPGSSPAMAPPARRLRLEEWDTEESVSAEEEDDDRGPGLPGRAWDRHMGDDRRTAVGLSLEEEKRSAVDGRWLASLEKANGPRLSGATWTQHVDDDRRRAVGLFVEEDRKSGVDGRLGDLLEKCATLQDSIGRKLAVYF